MGLRVRRDDAGASRDDLTAWERADLERKAPVWHSAPVCIAHTTNGTVASLTVTYTWHGCHRREVG